MTKDPIAPTAVEMFDDQTWWDIHSAGDAWPFSLKLEDQRVDPSADWSVARTLREPKTAKQEQIITARHPDHGLHGLAPEATYVLHCDTNQDSLFAGRELAGGWRIETPTKRTARLIRYNKKAMETVAGSRIV